LLALGNLLTGCEGTETGNPRPPPGIELRFSAYSNDFNRVAVGRHGDGLSLDRVFVALERFQLLPCSASGKSLDLSVGELQLTERPPPLLLAESEETDFCAASFRLAPGVGDQAAELSGRSAFVEGVRADGVPFQLASELDLTVDLASDTAAPFGSRRLLLAFNFATWLNGVGVETASIENGTVSIDSLHQPDLLGAFNARAGLAAALYDDTDGNGQLAGDNQPPAASP
jgi:hypothetical protein